MLLGGEFGWEGLDRGAVAVQVVAGQGGEDFQDAFGGGGGAVAVFGVDRDVVVGCVKLFGQVLWCFQAAVAVLWWSARACAGVR